MSRKRRVVGTVIFVLLLCICLTAYELLRYMDAPSQSKITLTHATTSDTVTFNTKPTDVQNEYFNFAYPAAMSPETEQPLTGSEIATYSYTYRDIESWQLTITVLNLPAPPLNNDSAYLFRAQHSEEYKPSTETVNGQSVRIMTDTEAGGFSEIAFLQHDTEVANISLLGNDSSGTAILNKTFSQILESWTWKK